MNEDIGLPKATILNLIKEFLPADTRISNEANEIILAMSREFVNHLSSISNDICLEGGKKTISQSHVAEAMKKLNLHDYLAKIMNVEDSKELEGMTEKKKKEILNSSLNVTRKKKKGISKEEEEELRKKQAKLFEEDQTIEMLPSELQRSFSSPPIQPTSSLPMTTGTLYTPSQLQFYDGSITQVLNNPVLNTGMKSVKAQPQSYSQFPQPGAPNNDQPEVTYSEVKEEEEEIIYTSKKQISDQENCENMAKIQNPGPAFAHTVSVLDIQPPPTPEQTALAQNQNSKCNLNL